MFSGRVLNVKTSLAVLQLFIYLFAFAKFGAHSMTFIGSRPATDCPAGPAVTRRGRVSRARLNDVTPNRPDTTLPDTKFREQIDYATRCHARCEINRTFQINDTIKIRTNRAHTAHARGSFFPQIRSHPLRPSFSLRFQRRGPGTRHDGPPAASRCRQEVAAAPLSQSYPKTPSHGDAARRHVGTSAAR